MTTTKLFVIEKHYASNRLKGEHDEPFKWIDERVFSENDAHHIDGEPVSAEAGARSELERLKGLAPPSYVNGYRLVLRTVKTTDKVLAEQ